MGERKGQNKYYPPDFDYKKHKSLDNYHGSHPLRERAKKLGQGILVIRFEMPYNIWCDGCGNHIGMGVRYNAEKSKIGNYYTTPIYKFKMKCHLCPSYIEIKTDPAAHDYVIISGARRKEQRWDPKENEQIVTDDKEMQKKLARDAMYRLEHTAQDTVKMKAATPGISQLAERREAHKEDYLMNKIAREKFRTEKKLMQSVTDEENALLKKSSLDIKLVAENTDDVNLAKLFKYRTVSSFDEKQKEKREQIANRPIFAKQSTSSSSTNPSPKDRRQRLNKLAGQLGIQRKNTNFSHHFRQSSASQGKAGSKTLSQFVKTNQLEMDSKDVECKDVEDANEEYEELSEGSSEDSSIVVKCISNLNSSKSSHSKALVGLGLDYESSSSGSAEET